MSNGYYYFLPELFCSKQTPFMFFDGFPCLNTKACRFCVVGTCDWNVFHFTTSLKFPQKVFYDIFCTLWRYLHISVDKNVWKSTYSWFKRLQNNIFKALPLNGGRGFCKIRFLITKSMKLLKPFHMQQIMRLIESTIHNRTLPTVAVSRPMFHLLDLVYLTTLSVNQKM